MSRARTEPVRIAVLAKAPVAGMAKTRLIPHLGADRAAALQRWLLRHTLATVQASEVGPVTLWCAPDTRHPDFAASRAAGRLRLRRQPAGDLGQRMHTAVAASPLEPSLVVGTDCPALTPALLREAAAALRTHDAVAIPAEDGGYVLIGLRQPVPAVFQGVDWSTERVMAQTRQRLQAAGLTWRELAPLWDVDRVEDVARLVRLFPEVASL